MKDLLIHSKYNAENIAAYRKYGISAQGSIFTCCLCGNPVDISSSFSNKGDRLICSACYRREFSGCLEATKWILNQE